MAAAILLIDLIHRRKCKKKAKLRLATKMAPKTDSQQLSKDCRICLGQGEISLFSKSTAENIVKNIKLFTGIEIVKDDDYPKFLCNYCYNLLQSAIMFRKLALETDEKLRMNKRKLRMKQKRTKNEEETDVEQFIETTNPITAKKPGSAISEEVDKQTMDDEPTWQEEDVNSEQEKYKCRKCNIEFDDSEKYLEHFNGAEHNARKHKPLKRTNCKLCHKSMVVAYLKTHMIRKHSNLKPFVCEVCGKSFPARSGLHHHVKIHSTDLPFACQECPYRGRCSYSLKIHMRGHTGEKPYSCHICPKQFAHQQNFMKHLNSHKTDYEFKCDQCDRGFHAKREMIAHIRAVHMGLKEHRCDECGREFAYRVLMIKHMRRMHKIITREPLYVRVEKEKLKDKETN